MRLLTYTFVALVAPLAAATRGQPGSRRALWVAALAIFAVSALHLSQLHREMPPGPSSCSGITPRCRWRWPSCIRTIPFALADLFLKRALALLALLALAFAGMLVLRLVFGSFARSRPARRSASLVTLWVATALLYPGAAPRNGLVRRRGRAAGAPTIGRFARLRRAVYSAHEDVAPLLSTTSATCSDRR